MCRMESPTFQFGDWLALERSGRSGAALDVIDEALRKL